MQVVCVCGVRLGHDVSLASVLHLCLVLLEEANVVDELLALALNLGLAQLHRFVRPVRRARVRDTRADGLEQRDDVALRRALHHVEAHAQRGHAEQRVRTDEHELVPSVRVVHVLAGHKVAETLLNKECSVKNLL